ncbi:MAG: 16S rRNA (adenine(1518)-N(6)/adenine(1519)-N(6))-dimethyltransferase RsmA [Enterobacterales bacterium]
MKKKLYKFLYKGHLLRKSFGQVFLHDNNIIKTIISLINPSINDVFIEIGPGFGSLTTKLAKYSTNIIAVEIDSNLSQYLSKILCLNKVIILNQNIFNINFKQLYYKYNTPLRLVGNLPYNISIKLLFYIFKYINFIKDMNFMFQKEVAYRLISTPNSKNYGKLSILAQYFCKITHLLEIPPISFYPKPKINSTFLKLTPHTKLPYKVLNFNSLIIVINLAFRNRRKTIKNNLSTLLNIRELTSLNIDLNKRAENLDIYSYCKLANFITNKFDNKLQTC